MHRFLLTLALASILLSIGCNRQSDFIYDTPPFVLARISTPNDGKAAIAARAAQFAQQRRMKVHFVPDHFEPHEFSLSLTRADLNIIATNVGLGDRSTVTAVARAAPTTAQHAEVSSYLYEVMRQGCSL